MRKAVCPRATQQRGLVTCGVSRLSHGGASIASDFNITGSLWLCPLIGFSDHGSEWEEMGRTEREDTGESYML